eukprot:g12520.t1
MHSVDAVNKHVEFTADMLEVDPATGAIWFNTDFESTSLPDANKWTKRLQQHLEDVHKNPESLPQGRRLGGAMSAITQRGGGWGSGFGSMVGGMVGGLRQTNTTSGGLRLQSSGGILSGGSEKPFTYTNGADRQKVVTAFFRGEPFGYPIFIPELEVDPATGVWTGHFQKESKNQMKKETVLVLVMVVLWMGEDGSAEIRVFQGRCPHNKGNLCGGEVLDIEDLQSKIDPEAAAARIMNRCLGRADSHSSVRDGGEDDGAVAVVPTHSGGATAAAAAVGAKAEGGGLEGGGPTSSSGAKGSSCSSGDAAPPAAFAPPAAAEFFPSRVQRVSSKEAVDLSLLPVIEEGKPKHRKSHSKDSSRSPEKEGGDRGPPSGGGGEIRDDGIGDSGGSLAATTTATGSKKKLKKGRTLKRVLDPEDEEWYVNLKKFEAQKNAPAAPPTTADAGSRPEAAAISSSSADRTAAASSTTAPVPAAMSTKTMGKYFSVGGVDDPEPVVRVNEGVHSSSGEEVNATIDALNRRGSRVLAAKGVSPPRDSGIKIDLRAGRCGESSGGAVVNGENRADPSSPSSSESSPREVDHDPSNAAGAEIAQTAATGGLKSVVDELWDAVEIPKLVPPHAADDPMAALRILPDVGGELQQVGTSMYSAGEESAEDVIACDDALDPANERRRSRRNSRSSSSFDMLREGNFPHTPTPTGHHLLDAHLLEKVMPHLERKELPQANGDYIQKRGRNSSGSSGGRPSLTLFDGDSASRRQRSAEVDENFKRHLESSVGVGGGPLGVSSSDKAALPGLVQHDSVLGNVSTFGGSSKVPPVKESPLQPKKLDREMTISSSHSGRGRELFGIPEKEGGAAAVASSLPDPAVADATLPPAGSDSKLGPEEADAPVSARCAGSGLEEAKKPPEVHKIPKSNLIRCPLHHWRFRLDDGVHVAGEDLEPKSDTKDNLKRYEHKIDENGKIWIKIGIGSSSTTGGAGSSGSQLTKQEPVSSPAGASGSGLVGERVAPSSGSKVLTKEEEEKIERRKKSMARYYSAT